jgi:predicted nucleic acid-binding protein
VAGTDLETALPAGASLLIDTSVVLAYLTGSELTSPLATRLFDSLIATGRNPAALSTVTVQEILVRPFRRGSAAVATAEGFLRHFAEIRIVDVSYEIAREAARIRSVTELRTPDALIIATAVVTASDVILTNDLSWRAAIDAAGAGVRVHRLVD